MKILICISQLTRGGAERVVSNLANYLSKNNDVTIAILRKREIEYELNHNVKIVELENEKNKNKNKLLKNIARYRKLSDFLEKENFDIVLSFLPEPSFLILSLKEKRNLKVIVSVRNDPKIEYKSKLYNLIMRKLYPKADGFVFQTQEAKEFFSSEIQNKSTIILNSLNPNFIVEESYLGEREKEIVSVGRLADQKNHKLLIKAFKKVSEKFPEYKLVIYGEGPLKNELDELIRELKLKDKVVLPGVEKNIKEKIYKASMFVLTSDFEGMPNSLLEALALGVPSISTDCPCGGPRELIKNGENGILIPVKNEEKLVEKMMYLLENPDKSREISINANNIKLIVNPEKINKEWEDYLRKIANI